MPVWISLSWINIHNGEKRIWIPPLGLLLFYFLGQAASSGSGKADNPCGVGHDDSTGDPLPPALHLWPIVLRLSPRRRQLNGAVVARIIDLADDPAFHFCWNVQKGAGISFAWISFARQRSKTRRHTFILLLPSSPLVLSQRPGAPWGSLAGEKTRSVHRDSSRCVYHEEDWLKGRLSWLHLDQVLHTMILLNWEDWTVFYSLQLQIRIICELKWIFR